MARRRFQNGTVYQRNGIWYARYFESVLQADGSEYRIRRNEPLGRFATKKLALRALDPTLAKLNARSYRPLQQGTWAEFAEEWADIMLANYKPSGQASAKSVLKTLKWFDKIKMNDLDTIDIQKFIAKSKCSAKTTKNRIAHMRSMWHQAKAWKYAQHDPFEELVLPEVEKQEQACYSPAQVRQIILAAKPPYNTVFWMFGETGMRRGELCGLNVGDLDPAMQYISVRRSRWGKHLTSPKSRKARGFHISKRLVARLGQFTSGRQADEPLFLSPEAYRLHPENLVKRVLKPILKQLGLNGACHAFRHGNVTEMGRQRTSPAVMQQRVGHSAFATTMEYMHVVSEDAIAVADALGEVYAIDLDSMEAVGGKQ